LELQLGAAAVYEQRRRKVPSALLADSKPNPVRPQKVSVR